MHYTLKEILSRLPLYPTSASDFLYILQWHCCKIMLKWGNLTHFLFLTKKPFSARNKDIKTYKCKCGLPATKSGSRISIFCLLENIERIQSNKSGTKNEETKGQRTWERASQGQYECISCIELIHSNLQIFKLSSLSL